MNPSRPSGGARTTFPTSLRAGTTLPMSPCSRQVRCPSAAGAVNCIFSAPSPAPSFLLSTHTWSVHLPGVVPAPSNPHPSSRDEPASVSPARPREAAPPPPPWGGLCAAGCVSRASLPRPWVGRALEPPLAGGGGAGAQGRGARVAAAGALGGCVWAAQLRPGLAREGRIAGAHGPRGRPRAGWESVLPVCLQLGVLWGGVRTPRRRRPGT